MRSPQVENGDYVSQEDRKRYSDLQVLKSPAGWYIGTMYSEDGFEEPGSRDSGYYETKELAEEALLAWEETGITTRPNP